MLLATRALLLCGILAITFFNALEVIDLSGSQGKVSMIRYFQNVIVDVELAESIRYELHADYCRFLEDRDELIFRYTLQPLIDDHLSDIHAILNFSGGEIGEGVKCIFEH